MLKAAIFTVVGAGLIFGPSGVSAAARCDIDLEVVNEFGQDVLLRSIRHSLVGERSTFSEETVLDATIPEGASYRVRYTDTGGQKCNKDRRLKLGWAYRRDGEEKLRNVITKVFEGGGTSMGVRITIDSDGHADLEVSSY